MIRKLEEDETKKQTEHQKIKIDESQRKQEIKHEHEDCVKYVIK